jgi:Plasmid recombination enzyme
MSNVFFLRIEKLTPKGIIRTAARHNLREMYRYKTPPISIDPSKSHLNVILKGASTAQGVNAHAKQLMVNAGITKVRSNAVRCIEVLFSLPFDTQLNVVEYFSECVAWAGKYFSGAENILTAIIHLDQANPHCHLLLLPIKNNRLCGSEMFGKRGNLIAMQQDFKKEVASKNQLQIAANRATAAEKRELATRVRGVLKKRNDVVLSSPIWELVKIDIERNPALYVDALGDGYFSVEPLQDNRQIHPQAFGISSVQNNQTLSCVRV